MKLALIALVVLLMGCVTSPEFQRARWEVILPGSTEPQRVIEPPTHCEVEKSAGRPCLEPAASNKPI